MKHLTWDDVVAEALRFPVEPLTAADGAWTDTAISSFRKMNPYLSLAETSADPAAAVRALKSEAES